MRPAISNSEVAIFGFTVIAEVACVTRDGYEKKSFTLLFEPKFGVSRFLTNRANKTT